MLGFVMIASQLIGLIAFRFALWTVALPGTVAYHFWLKPKYHPNTAKAKLYAVFVWLAVFIPIGIVGSIAEQAGR